jgi:methylmalonyl-CoA mutase C-terminal domain/subunit
MNDQGLETVPLIGGGIIPDDDVAKLKALGVSEVFGPGTNTRDIVTYVKSLFEKKAKK